MMVKLVDESLYEGMRGRLVVYAHGELLYRIHGDRKRFNVR